MEINHLCSGLLRVLLLLILIRCLHSGRPGDGRAHPGAYHP